MTTNIDRAARWYLSNTPCGYDSTTDTLFSRNDQEFRRGYALRLAKAEAWAKANKATFWWAIDKEIRFDDGPEPGRCWRCSLSIGGKLLATGAPEDYGRIHPLDDPYGYNRVSQAALALQYLSRRDDEAAAVCRMVASAKRPALDLCAA
jgi:hypothetical protein